MFEVSDKLHLTPYTTQLAMVYLDKLISKFDICKVQKQIYLWATTLLLIASKFNELDAHIPYIEDFKKVAEIGKFSYNSVVRCEREICNKLKWDFMVVSPITFVQAHHYYGLVFGDDKVSIGKTHPMMVLVEHAQQSSKEVKSQLEAKINNIYKYSEFFSNIALQMPEAQRYPYSLQALCAILVARKVNKVEPVWNTKFEARQSHKYYETKELVQILYSKHLRVNKKSEGKIEQKENKVMTVKMDMNQR